MKRFLFALMLFASPAFAEQPIARLTGPQRVEPGGMILLSAGGSVSDEPPVIVAETGQPVQLDGMPLFVPDGKGGYSPFGFLATAPSIPGTYRFICIARGQVDGKWLYSATTFSVAVGTTPVPPKPDDPVDPIDPPPPPAPKGVARVMFLSESSANMTREQINILNSTVLRDFLKSIVEVDERNTYGWRFWDKDIDTSYEAKTWQDFWAKVKSDPTPLPRVSILYDDGQTETVPLPETEQSLIDELKTREGR